MRILLIEDEPVTRMLLALHLRGEGMEVDEAGSLAEADRRLAAAPPDLAVVDLMLEDGDSFVLIPRLAAMGIGLIVASARRTAEDRVRALELGADDYVTKPVDARELVLRLRKLHARLTGTRPAPVAEALAPLVYRFAGYAFDATRQTLTDPEGRRVDLTGAQMRVLELFLENPTEVLARETIAEHVHGRQWLVEGRAVDVLVSKLRGRIDRPGAPSLIRSVRGLGYRLAAEVRRGAA